MPGAERGEVGVGEQLGPRVHRQAGRGGRDRSRRPRARRVLAERPGRAEPAADAERQQQHQHHRPPPRHGRQPRPRAIAPAQRVSTTPPVAPAHALGHPADQVAGARDVALAPVHDDLDVRLPALVEVEPAHEAVAGVALVAAVGVLQRVGAAVEDVDVLLLALEPLDPDVDRVLDGDVLAVDLLDAHHVGVVGRAGLLPLPLVRGVGVGGPADGRGEGDLELAGAPRLGPHLQAGLEGRVVRVLGGRQLGLDGELGVRGRHRGGGSGADGRCRGSRRTRRSRSRCRSPGARPAPQAPANPWSPTLGDCPAGRRARPTVAPC